MARTRHIDPACPFQPLAGACKITGLSIAWLRAGCKAGIVPHVEVGTDYRVNVPALLEQAGI